MRTRAAWIVGMTLTGTSIACTPATYGIGDSDDGVSPADSLETGEFGDAGELGDDGPTPGDGDGDEGLEGDGDPGPMQTCTDPPAEMGVDITFHGEHIPIEDCDEPKLSARIMNAEGGKFLIKACACEDPECNGEVLELDIALPDPEWLPQLDPGTCYFFHLYSEEVEPGVCRRNRIDISIDKHEAPWYSAGSASEDLSHNGLTIEPIVADACTDDCGEWQVRDVIFVAQDSEQKLAWGEDAWIGAYKVVNWQSYATPSGCGTPGADVTSWTAK